MEKEKSISFEQKKEIMALHIKLNHKKTIKDNLKRLGISVPEHKLIEILKECRVCMRKDRQYAKTCCYLEMKGPGEGVGVDILNIGPGKNIIVLIDDLRENF